MKVLKKVIYIENETVSVPIKGTDRFVLVYSRPVKSKDKGDLQTVIMEKVKYEAAKKPEQIKRFEFVPEHLKKEKYKAWFDVFTKAQVEAIRDGVGDWYDKRYGAVSLEFGQELPDDYEVLGYSYADYTFFDMNLNFINRVVRDFYLDRNYDIRAIVQNEKDNPDVVILPESRWSGDKDRDPIYWVNGNGDTLNLGLRLTDEQYAAYRNCGVNRHAYLMKNTILSKYRRPEPKYNYDADEDDGY